MSANQNTTRPLELGDFKVPAPFEKQSTYGKVRELTIIVYREMQQNPVLLMCMIGGTITKLVSVLFSTYLILWIQTFATGTNGSPVLLQSKEQGKTIYSNIMVLATLISAFVLPVAGQVCDAY